MPGFSGAAVPATEAARNDTIIGRPLGSAMPTRSPRLDAGRRELFRDRLHLIAQRAVGEADGCSGRMMAVLSDGACSSRSTSVDDVWRQVLTTHRRDTARPEPRG